MIESFCSAFFIIAFLGAVASLRALSRLEVNDMQKLLSVSGPRIKKPLEAPKLASLKSSSLYSRVARLANISGKEAARSFEKAEWKRIGQVGSHLVMSKPGLRVNLSIPQHKELSLGTLRALIRHAGMTVEEFLGLL
jgi:predicted RNA binding protein YcfA (HicA-like mRNA interferase family)